MPNTSSKTTPVAFRLPIDVYAIIKRRSDKMGIEVSEYLKRRVSYDTNRKH